MPYDNVVRALYSYEAADTDELSFIEDELLCLIPGAPDDSWHFAHPLKEPERSGLVPANYVEPLESISTIRAIYDYEAQEGNEISFNEGEVLTLLDRIEEWWLVCNVQGKYGMVPCNYFEEEEKGEEEKDTVDHSGNIFDRPIKETMTIKTKWPSAKVTKKWTAEITTTDLAAKKVKGKLVILDRKMAVFIQGKEKIIEFYFPLEDVKSFDKKTGDLILRSNGERKGISLGKNDRKEFYKLIEENKPLLPIPVAMNTTKVDDYPSYDPPEEEQVNGYPIVALYDYEAQEEDEITIYEGENIKVIDDSGEDWWLIVKSDGSAGLVPKSYLIDDGPLPIASQDVLSEEILQEETLIASDTEQPPPAYFDELLQKSQQSMEMLRKLDASNRSNEECKSPSSSSTPPPQNRDAVSAVSSATVSAPPPPPPPLPSHLRGDRNDTIVPERKPTSPTVAPAYVVARPSPINSHLTSSPPTPLPQGSKEVSRSSSVRKVPLTVPPPPAPPLPSRVIRSSPPPAPPLPSRPTQSSPPPPLPERERQDSSPPMKKRLEENSLNEHATFDVPSVNMIENAAKSLRKASAPSSIPGKPPIEHSTIRKSTITDTSPLKSRTKAVESSGSQQLSHAPALAPVPVKSNPWAAVSLKKTEKHSKGGITSSTSTDALYKMNSLAKALPSRPDKAVSDNKPSPVDTRLWKDKSGKFQTEASFISYEKGIVTLHKLNGTKVPVSIEMLSERDVEYVLRRCGLAANSIATKPNSNSSSTYKVNGFDWLQFLIDSGIESNHASGLAAQCVHRNCDEVWLDSITREKLKNTLNISDGDALLFLQGVTKRKLRKLEKLGQDKLLKDLAKSISPPPIQAMATKPPPMLSTNIPKNIQPLSPTTTTRSPSLPVTTPSLAPLQPKRSVKDIPTLTPRNNSLSSVAMPSQPIFREFSSSSQVPLATGQTAQQFTTTQYVVKRSMSQNAPATTNMGSSGIQPPFNFPMADQTLFPGQVIPFNPALMNQPAATAVGYIPQQSMQMPRPAITLNSQSINPPLLQPLTQLPPATPVPNIGDDKYSIFRAVDPHSPSLLVQPTKKSPTSLTFSNSSNSLDPTHHHGNLR